MSDAVTMEGLANLMARLALVKNVEVTKVARNAARDFARAALAATPLAKPKTPWLAVHSKSGAAVRFVRVDKAPWSEAGQAHARRVPIRYRRGGDLKYIRRRHTRPAGIRGRGFAKASWVWAMMELEIPLTAYQRRAGAKAGRLSDWELAVSGPDGARAELENRLDYLGGKYAPGIMAAGLARAEAKIVAELDRIEKRMAEQYHA